MDAVFMKHFRKVSHRSLAGFLMVWLSGVVFLFCCEMPTEAAEGDFCPLSKAESHCDKTADEYTLLAVSERSNSAFDCCGFLPVVFDKTRKLEPKQNSDLVTSDINVVLRHFTIVHNYRDIFVRYCSTLLPQNNLRIKHCVFRT